MAAASVGPVLPAETRASARPSFTERAAWTIEASGFERTAWAGSSCPPIVSGASTTSTPPPLSPSSAAGPKRSTSEPERRAPSATAAGPLSAPFASTAITG